MALYYQNQLIEWIDLGEDLRPSIILHEEKIKAVKKIYKSVGVFSWGSYLKVNEELRKTLEDDNDSMFSVAATSRDIKRYFVFRSVVRLGTLLFASYGLYLSEISPCIEPSYNRFLMGFCIFAIACLSFFGTKGFTSAMEKSIDSIQKTFLR